MIHPKRYAQHLELKQLDVPVQLTEVYVPPKVIAGRYRVGHSEVETQVDHPHYVSNRAVQ